MPRPTFKRRVLLSPLPPSTSSRDVLTDIYQGKQPSEVHVPTPRTRSAWPLRMGMALVFVACISTFGIVWSALSTPSIKFGEEMIDFAVTGPENIGALSLGDYTFTYGNRGVIPLTGVKIVFFPPQGFFPVLPLAFSDTEIPVWQKNTQGSLEIVLPDLMGGMSGNVTLSGSLLGSEGDAHVGRATMSFQPQGFGAAFYKNISVRSTQGAPRVLLGVTAQQGSESLVDNVSTVVLDIRVRNTLPHAVDSLAVQFSLPPTTKVLLSDPPVVMGSAGEVRFPIDTLPEKGLWQASIELALPHDRALAPIMVVLHVVKGAMETRINSQEVAISTMTGKGLARVRLNGIDGLTTLQQNKTLKIELVATSTGKTPLSGIALQGEFIEQGGTFIAWEKIKSTFPVRPLSALQTNGRVTQVVFRKEVVKALEEILPGKDVIVSFEVPVQGNGTILQSTPTLIILDQGKEVSIQGERRESPVRP